MEVDGAVSSAEALNAHAVGRILYASVPVSKADP
jgi:hypothetical protein